MPVGTRQNDERVKSAFAAHLFSSGNIASHRVLTVSCPKSHRKFENSQEEGSDDDFPKSKTRRNADIASKTTRHKQLKT
jgi:hypothetical protein